MTPLLQLLQHNPAGAWVYLPSAVLLGALHGLEPGHSKTMMAAFIIAIRGTVAQAVLLGLSATLSHTAVVWAVALTGLYFGNRWDAAASEPYLQMMSGMIVIAVALWMMFRVHREHRAEIAHRQESVNYVHVRQTPAPLLNTGLRIDPLRKSGVIASSSGAAAETSFTPIQTDYSDAHERAHANEIRRRFSARQVTTGQIVLFGLTGGLIPCPASITVLVLCLQLKQFGLGVATVFAFSLGLASTMVSVGALAALGARHLGTQLDHRWPGLARLARGAPYVSGALILVLGVYLIYSSGVL